MRKLLSRAMIFAAVTLAFTQTACVTRGENFSSDTSWIKRGQTTEAEVQKYLGAPFSVGNSGGTRTSTYGFYNYSAFGDTKTKELKFYWNKDARVEDFSFNSSFPEDRRRNLEK